MMNPKGASIRIEPGSNPPGAPASRISSRWLSAARVGWWIVIVLAIAMMAGGISVLYANLQTGCAGADCPYQLTALQLQQLKDLGLSVSFFAIYFSVLLPLVHFIYFFVAFLLYFRRPTGWIGLLGAYTLVLFGGITFLETTNLVASIYPALVLPVLILDYLGDVLLALFVIAFPDGRIYPRWSLALVAAWAILRIPLPSWPIWIADAVWVALFGSLILVQYYRYRRVYSPVLRQQTKWVVYGLLVALSSYTIVRVVYLMLPKAVQEAVLMIIFTDSVAYLVMTLIPISIAIAIFRYRLWDIDLLINRTLVYIPLTGILGGLYTATVATFQKIFIATTGTTSDAAIILTTFIVAATFTPVKNGLQLAVDKRFKEPVDPLKEIGALDQQVRSVVDVLDPGLVTNRLLDTSTHALHATGGAIYLEQNGQVHLAQATPGWKDEDRKVSLPLHSNGRQIGQLSLGAREGDVEYSHRECQALQEAADQVARVLASFGKDISV